MKRKEFIKKSVLATTVIGNYPFLTRNIQKGRSSDGIPYEFKLNYAPKFGMFKEHAGEDLIDQLKFISDTGFKGLTDDRMRKRSISDQKSIGEVLEVLNLRMGVIGGHAYSWNKEHLVTGDKDTVDSFLEEIKSKNTIFGYECNGSELEWKDGLPFPTFRDSTPKTFSVLCTAPSSWHPGDCEWYEKWENGRVGAACLGYIPNPVVQQYLLQLRPIGCTDFAAETLRLN